MKHAAGPRETQEIGGLVAGIERLPPAPSTYFKIAELAAHPALNLAAVTRVLEGDPGLSVNVLQLVNSAFFGRMQKTTSIQQAVQRLGLEALKSLVLSVHVFKGATGVRGLSIENFQAYSVLVARMAREFVSPKYADEAFTAGLVHDIGKLVLAITAPDGFVASLDTAMTRDDAPFLLEREHAGFDHAEAGAYLLAIWKIPKQVVNTVRFHHQPSQCPDPPNEVLAAVHAADALVGIVSCGEPESRLDIEYLERANVIERLPRWRAIVAAG